MIGMIVVLYLLSSAVLLFIAWRAWRAHQELRRQHRRLRQRCRMLGIIAAKHEPDKVSCYWGSPMIRQPGGGWIAYDDVDDDRGRDSPAATREPSARRGKQGAL